MITLHQMQELEERRLFFQVLGIEDDGRRHARMTDEEFAAIKDKIIDGDGKAFKYGDYVEVDYKWTEYGMISYVYSLEDGEFYSRYLHGCNGD